MIQTVAAPLDVHEARKLIDERLERYMATQEPMLEELNDSIRYSLHSGGKRIRPLFAFIVGELYDVPWQELVSPACALEMVHTASLIMDDLPHMDNARMRRGRPANHMVYGQDVATLASIGLLSRAYEVVMDDPALPNDIKVKVIRKLAGVVGLDGMVGGQFVDLKFLNPSVDFPTLEYVHLHKTASLFAVSGETAAIIGNAAESEVQAIRSYALNLGFAYQILDDVLDATGNAAEVGKTVRNDRANFISLFGVEKSRELAEKYTQEAIASLEVFGNRKKKLVDLTFMLLKRGS